MENDQKTVLKLTLLNLCDILKIHQIEDVIAYAEDQLDALHIFEQDGVRSQ